MPFLLLVDPNMLVLQIESWGKASSAKSAQDLQATQYGNLKAVVEKFKIKKDDFSTTKTTRHTPNISTIRKRKTIK